MSEEDQREHGVQYVLLNKRLARNLTYVVNLVRKGLEVDRGGRHLLLGGVEAVGEAGGGGGNL